MRRDAGDGKGCDLTFGPGRDGVVGTLPDLGVRHPCRILLFPDGPNALYS